MSNKDEKQKQLNSSIDYLVDPNFFPETRHIINIVSDLINTGNLSDYKSVCIRIMQSDPSIQHAVKQMYVLMRLYQYKIESGKDSTLEEFVMKNWKKLIESYIQYLFIGYILIHTYYDEDEKEIKMKNYNDVTNSSVILYLFKGDRAMRSANAVGVTKEGLYNIDVNGNYVRLTKPRFHFFDSGSLGYGRALINVVLNKTNSISDWKHYLKKFATPSAYVKVPMGTSRSVKEQILSQLEDMEGGSYGLIEGDEDTTIEQLQTSSISTSSAYENYDSVLDGVIIKLLLSGSLNTEQGAKSTGTYSQAIVHEQSTQQLIQATMLDFQDFVNNILYNMSKVPGRKLIQIKIKEKMKLSLQEVLSLNSELREYYGYQIDKETLKDYFLPTDCKLEKVSDDLRHIMINQEKEEPKEEEEEPKKELGHRSLATNKKEREKKEKEIKKDDKE